MDHLGLFEDNNNLMMKTKRVKDTGGDASKATYLKLEQIKEMQQKYIQGKLITSLQFANLLLVLNILYDE